MEVRCACGNAQEIAEDAFGEHGSIQVKCAACGQNFRVVSPKTLTLKVETTRRSVPDISSYYLEDGRELSLPKDKELTLKLLEGGGEGDGVRDCQTAHHPRARQRRRDH